MQDATRKTILMLCIVSTVFLSGCTNWQKKYEALNVEYQNTLGLLERERAEKGQLVDQLTQGQQTIEELQRQVVGRNRTPAEATGFGKGYDVRFDPSAGAITVTLPNATAAHAVVPGQSIPPIGLPGW